VFIGHFALGFGAKRLVPKASLGTLFLACQLADLLWPTLVLAGAESFQVEPGMTAVTPLDFTHYPYSHSLLGLAVYGLVLGLSYGVVRRDAKGVLVLGALVVSHWLLDFASHRPDMPLTFGGAGRYGLGLWDSIGATMLVEIPLFAGGVLLYAFGTRATAQRGTWGLWSLVGFLTIVYFANLFGPPPPNVEAVAWSAQAIWLLVLWAYWVDRHREARAAGAAR
jgi:hypothetical protein